MASALPIWQSPTIREAGGHARKRLLESVTSVWSSSGGTFAASTWLADVRFIARKLGIGARTVYRYKDLSEPPSRQSHRSRASVLDPHVTYLLGRWNEGCRNGKRLFQEIQERGYDHSERTFIRFTAELRRMEAAGKPPSFAPRARKGSVAGLSPSAKNVAALFMR